MKNKLEYRIEDGSLIIDNYFNNLKISSTNCGVVDSILGKCESFDEKYGALLKENKQLKERIEYLERSNNRREDTILEQRQEISDLEDNWNKLKEWLNNFHKSSEFEQWEIVKKIQELEQGSDSE